MLKLLKKLRDRLNPPKAVVVVEKKMVEVTVKTIDSRKESFDVNKTLTKITFNDGRTFKTTIYGTVSQYVNYPNAYSFSKEAEVGLPNVLKSEEYVIQMMRFFKPNEISTFYDDNHNPRKITVGTVQSIEILKTTSHKMDYPICFVKEEQKLVEAK